MCRYCNCDVRLHYLLNDAPVSESLAELNHTSHGVAVAAPAEDEFVDFVAEIQAGGPEFNAENWDFGDGDSRKLFTQIGVQDRPLYFSFAADIFKGSNQDNLTFTASLASGQELPNWLNIDSVTGNFWGLPDATGNWDIKLTATDLEGNSTAIEFDLAVPADQKSPIGKPGGVSDSLQLWLKGDAGIVQSATGVSAWLDQSGNNLYASQGIVSYQPSWQPQGLNNQPTLAFSPQRLLSRGLLGDHLDLASNSNLNSEELTVYIVSQVIEEQDKDELASSATIDDDGWEIFSGSYDALSEISLNDFPGASGSPIDLSNETKSLRIGGSGSGYYAEDPFAGGIAEILLFDQILPQSDRQKVESYLAVKYGLSLDQTTPQSYVDSQGSIWWDAHSAGDFKYNIAGLVQDDNSGLLLTKSTAEAGIVSMELAEPAELSTGESLFWSDNGVPINIDNLESQAPHGYDGRLNRVWQVRETGEVGQVTLSFDLSGLDFDTSQAANFALLLDDNSAFTEPQVHINEGQITDQIISFASINLDEAQYFTLAVPDAVNHNPQGTDHHLIIQEDTNYFFKAEDFGFQDQDDNDTLTKVIITKLPGHGLLELNGVVVETGDEIELEKLSKLNFTPGSDEFGESYTNLEFRVHDGEAFSLFPSEMTISVEPIVEPSEILATTASDVDDGKVLDLMIVYTQGALEQAGGWLKFKAEIEQEIDALNTALVSSGVNYTVNVVRYSLLPKYQGVDNHTDLTRLHDPSDGYLDQVHQWRDRSSADFVSLITTGPGTGVGYQPGAFNVLSYGMRQNLGHELGHNFGAAHDVYNGGKPNAMGFRSLEQKIATIMSYGQGGVTRTNLFSNPQLIIDDVAFGNDFANNVARLNTRSLLNANRRHSNDNLAQAAPLKGHNLTVETLNYEATKEELEPDIGHVSGDNSVWWSWTASQSVPVEINTFGSDFDTLLAVYQGSEYDDLVEVVHNDDAHETQSQVVFTPVAGEAYKIAIASKDNTGGQIKFSLQEAGESDKTESESKETTPAAVTDLRRQPRESQLESLRGNNAGKIQKQESSLSTAITTVHRFFQYSAGFHFYTAEPGEIDAIKESIASGELEYSYESESFSALSHDLDNVTGEAIPGVQPVYRFLNQDTGAYLFTIDVKEKDYVIDNLEHYQLEGIAYYGFAEERPEFDTIPVYRMLNNSNGTHLFTTSPQELAHIEANLPHFIFEANADPAFHVLELP